MASFRGPLFWLSLDSNEFFHHPYDACFVTSVYGPSATMVDRPPDVQKFHSNNTSYYHFYAFTNLPDLDAPGWDLVIHPLPQYNQSVVQSRWPKFMGWNHSVLQYKCDVVFYGDGMYEPNATHPMVPELIRRVKQSPIGFLQTTHRTAMGPHDELDRIVRFRKDTRARTNVTKAWIMFFLHTFESVEHYFLFLHREIAN